MPRHMARMAFIPAYLVLPSNQSTLRRLKGIYGIDSTYRTSLSFIAAFIVCTRQLSEHGPELVRLDRGNHYGPERGDHSRRNRGFDKHGDLREAHRHLRFVRKLQFCKRVAWFIPGRSSAARFQALQPRTDPDRGG